MCISPLRLRVVLGASAFIVIIPAAFYFGCAKQENATPSTTLSEVVIGDNLLRNGSFEPVGDVEKSPAEWYATRIPATSAFVNFAWDDKVYHSGLRSVSISINKNHPVEQGIAYNWTQAITTFQAGKQYQLTGWVKTENLSGPAWICVQAWDSTDRNMIGFGTTQHDYPVSGTSDWTRIGTIFTVPVGTHDIVIRAGNQAPENNGGTVWYDDISFRAVE